VALQARLTALGYNPGTADGDFNSATTAAVIAFQRAKGLPPMESSERKRGRH